MLIANNLLDFPGGETMSIKDVKRYVKRYLERIKNETMGANLLKERVCVLLDANNIKNLSVDPNGGIAAFFAIDDAGKFTIILMSVNEDGELIPSNGVTAPPPVERWEATSSLTATVNDLTDDSIDNMIK